MLRLLGNSKDTTKRKIFIFQKFIILKNLAICKIPQKLRLSLNMTQRLQTKYFESLKEIKIKRTKLNPEKN